MSKVYRMGEVETHALNGVSLSIGRRRIYGAGRPVGFGQDDAAAIDRLPRSSPISGAVKINGQDVTRFNANQRADLRRKEIGFIFQFFALVPVLNAYENVELPLLLSNVKAAERSERVMELLKARRAWPIAPSIAPIR